MKEIALVGMIFILANIHERMAKSLTNEPQKGTHNTQNELGKGVDWQVWSDLCQRESKENGYRFHLLKSDWDPTAILRKNSKTTKGNADVL